MSTSKRDIVPLPGASIAAAAVVTGSAEANARPGTRVLLRSIGGDATPIGEE